MQQCTGATRREDPRFILLMYGVAAFTAGRSLTRGRKAWWAAVPIAAGTAPVLAVLAVSGTISLEPIVVIPIAGILLGGWGPGSNGAESNEPASYLVLFELRERLTISAATVRTGFGAFVEVGGRWRFSSSPTSRWSGFGRIRTSAGRS
ncbi:ABC transporter permease [Nonomuraea sp. NEAU-A123]|uniref:ABC transporter permease n=1 Tax=Nonomuraea sp. NEAU-A123 TaxID=2839649 RepID=UPI001BE45F21|nr:ABC transporter permease [Nonomuraea sp. NEAU-A123]MBT2225086.1 ABC transporter permease [Nonomuraea sp. NEAU-A123]